MKQRAFDDQEAKQALTAEFKEEVDGLVRSVSRVGQLEAIMRIRAMAEIGDHLTTEQLLDLAVRVVDSAAPPARRQAKG